MKPITQKRWMRSAISSAQGMTTALPWQRGAGRAARLARRDAGAAQQNRRKA